jgi:hypothetical protein
MHSAERYTLQGTLGAEDSREDSHTWYSRVDSLGRGRGLGSGMGWLVGAAHPAAGWGLLPGNWQPYHKQGKGNNVMTKEARIGVGDTHTLTHTKHTCTGNPNTHTKTNGGKHVQGMSKACTSMSRACPKHAHKKACTAACPPSMSTQHAQGMPSMDKPSMSNPATQRVQQQN